MDAIKNIKHFDSAYELLEEYYSETLDNMDPGERDAIRCVDDWEGFSYTVINNETVLISEFDDVIETTSVLMFLCETVDYIMKGGMR